MMNCHDVKIQNCVYIYYKINKGDAETSNYKITFSTVRQSRDSSNAEGETDSHSCTRSRPRRVKRKVLVCLSVDIKVEWLNTVRESKILDLQRQGI